MRFVPDFLALSFKALPSFCFSGRKKINKERETERKGKKREKLEQHGGRYGMRRVPGSSVNMLD